MAAMLPDAEVLGVQVVVCGGGGDAAPAFPPHARVVHHAGGDLFMARARGMEAASGDAAHGGGQLVGVLTGSPGRSHRRLE